MANRVVIFAEIPGTPRCCLGTFPAHRQVLSIDNDEAVIQHMKAALHASSGMPRITPLKGKATMMP